MMQIPEKRQYPRRTAYIIAECTTQEGTFRDIIKNIGAGGLFIKTNRKVSVGQPITVKFPLFNLGVALLQQLKIFVIKDSYRFNVANFSLMPMR